MGYSKDLWTKPKRVDGRLVRDDKGKEIREPNNDRWGKGKRWLACWTDPDGNTPTKAFGSKTVADKYWRDQESARDRGEYIDPKAGAELISALGVRWLGSISVDPKSRERYEQVWRLHIQPEFGRRSIKSMTKPSEVQEFLTKLGGRYGDPTVTLTRFVFGAVLELAVADGDLRKNPVRHRIVSTGKKPAEKVTVWSDAAIWALIDAHPPGLRALPFTGVTTGLREGELYGLAEDAVDFDGRLLHVRRQIKLIGRTWCFALPKGNREREVPFADVTAGALRVHMANYRPVAVTLPWGKPDGPLRTFRLIFVHPESGRYLQAGGYRQYWLPALLAAGVITATPGPRGGMRYVLDSRRNGRHNLRHKYAADQLSNGTTITELAASLGHQDPAFTLRVYGHLQPDSHDRVRAAVDAKYFRPRAVAEK